VRVRRALADCDWLDGAAIARSAANLADADSALEWAARAEWSRSVTERNGLICIQPEGIPAEILRRLVGRAIRRMATEGDADLRGRELDRLLATLADGPTATLRGVSCSGGDEWRFRVAPQRKG
jgi:tRNA(Ile)-lysidine synthase